MKQLSKAELKQRLLLIAENLPTQEEISSFGFNLGVINSGDQLLTNEAKTKLVAQIKSAKTTKDQLRRALALLSGLAKIATLFA